jgi:maltose/moltooligosaccharide transporter
MNKPRLSFWQIWNMSFGFLGIQFGWGLQLANMSPIYKYLHAEESSLPYLWLAGPITGLLIQPIIGSMSDRTWNRLGRRRPYFLTGAILASLALFVMPDSSAVWMAAGLLWILDASINITMEPFRAFVAGRSTHARFRDAEFFHRHRSDTRERVALLVFDAGRCGSYGEWYSAFG